jgi:hypothetical protein
MPELSNIDEVDGKTTGLTDDDICLLPTASEGQILQRGASEWGAVSIVPDWIFLKAKDGWPSTTSGCAAVAAIEYVTNDVDLQVMAFDKDADEFAQWTTIMPYAGTCTATFFWTCASGIGGEGATVQWVCQGRSYGNDDAIDQAWGDAQSVSDTWIADDDVHVSGATASITIPGATAGDLLQIRVQRDISEDDLNGDARLIGVLLTFTRS